MDEESVVDSGFRLFAKPKTRLNPKPASNPSPVTAADASDGAGQIEKVRDTDSAPAESSFADLGLRESLQQTCKAMGMKQPTPVQVHCIPKILAGRDVLGLAQTGSGKTAAFALPILHRLDEERYGVFALVITPTRELAYQLSEQFKALGSALHVRCSVVVGGMDMLTQAKSLTARPHIVISTPGRIRVLLEETPDIPPVFANTKFLVLDEADRVLDSGFEDELKAIFKCLPKNRQTLLFSATMTSNLQTLLEVSGNKAYFYEAYEGFQTVETLNQQYVFISKDIKELFLVYLLSKMDELGIRSAIIFVSTCRGCHHLSLILEELEQEAAALHSFKSQSLRLAALNQFKSRKVPILLTTDVGNRGLDIPTVDLVVNFDIPRDPRDYVHRVGRTARAGRGGRAISFVTQKDIDLIKEIEAKLGKQLEEFEYKENEVLEESRKVSNAKRVASMKMMDDGFDEKQKERKQQKLRTLAQKGLLKKKQRSQKRKRSNKTDE